MRFLLSFVAGLAGDLLLYRVMHREGFPELGRYGLGGVLIILSSWLIANGNRPGEVLTCDDVALTVSGACVSVGSGVFAGRLIQILLGW